MTNTQMQTFRAAMQDRIAGDRFTSAARLVMEAIRVKLVPPGADLVRWLEEQFGADSLKKIVASGLARLNSPCCSSGYEECPTCDGNGRHEGGGCVDCLTLGRLRCPFCNGSSLVLFSELPEPLRLPTAEARVKLADAAGRALLSESLPDATEDSTARSEISKHLLNLDKLLGVYENALIEVRRTPEGMKHEPHIHKSANTVHTRTFAAFERLTQCLAHAADSDQPTASDAAAKLQVVREVCQRHSLRQSKLAHPFLFVDPASP